MGTDSHVSPNTVTEEFLLTASGTGRSISDAYWEEIDSTYIEYWEQASTALANWSYASGDSRVSIEIDWRPMVRRHRETYRVMERIFSPTLTSEERENIRFPRRAVRMPCRALVDAAERRFKASHHVESLIYDIFLMMNIAAPGCCDFGSATLRERHSSKPFLGVSRFSLSNFQFDCAYLQSKEGKWPSVSTLPLQQVIAWFAATRRGAAQIPENRAEKVLFALLHIGHSDLSANTVIWVFYGLETLFDTRPGENFQALVRRAELLLSPSTDQSAYLRRQLRSLYDIRSAFVHGGLDVLHPMNNEAIDNRVDTGYRRLMDAVEFGFALLLASVQEVIRRNWLQPNFEEVLSGNSAAGRSNGA